MRGLVLLSNPALRQKSVEVKKVSSKIKKLAKELTEFLDAYQADNIRAIGLAAPEVGELVRLIAFRRNPFSVDLLDIQVLINPTLVYAKDFRLVTEMCLNIPGKKFTLRRAKIVKIRGLNLDGIQRTFRGHDLLAQVFQHELDHLDGILIDQTGELEIHND